VIHAELAKSALAASEIHAVIAVCPYLGRLREAFDLLVRPEDVAAALEILGPEETFSDGDEMTRLTRAAIIVTPIAAVLILLSKDVGRMLTTEGDLLVWRVPFSQVFIRVPDGAGFLILLPPLALFVVIVLWGFVAMTFLSFRLMGWHFRRVAPRARANLNPSDMEHAYVQGYAVQFFPAWLAVLILLVLGWAAWKLAAWAISLLP
jgi:hypothetical protein